MKQSIFKSLGVMLLLFIGILTLHSDTVNASSSDDFVIENNVLIQYRGTDTVVTIPENVTAIHSHAFKRNTTITEVTIPSGVTTIGENAFMYCTNLTTVHLPDTLTTIEDYCFYGCTSLKNIQIPDSVTELNHFTFTNCSSLASINLPDGLTYIGSEFLSGCSSIKEITIPDSVTYIAGYAFADTSISEVTIPASVSEITNTAFQNCSKLVKIHLSKENTTFRLYKDVLYTKDLSTLVILPNGLSGTITLPKQVSDLTGLNAGTSSKITAYAIKNGVNYIAKDGVLYSKDGKTLAYCPTGRTNSFTVPSTVRTIGKSAFQNCTKLKTVKILYGTEKIDFYAFYGCSSLKTIQIPDSVTWINDGAFSLCDTLDSLTIPSSVTKLGYYGDKFYEYDLFDDWESAEFCTEQFYASRFNTSITIICDKNSILYKKLNSYVPYFAEFYDNANWKAASTVTIKFNANSGKVKTTSKSVIKNTTFGSLPSPTRAGYTFKGWYTKKSGGTKVTPDTKCSSSRTLYAHWKKISVSKAKISKTSSTKKGQVAITVKQQSGVSGYRIYYSTNKNFKNAKYVSGPNPSKTIKNLTSKKTYYIRVRAYTIDSAGKKVYGTYSSTVKIKAK